jgi:hypothetical protein
MMPDTGYRFDLHLVSLNNLVQISVISGFIKRRANIIWKRKGYW